MSDGSTPESKRARRLATLRRRADYLQKHIDQNPDDTGKSWNRREVAALRWAIEQLDPTPPAEESHA